MLAKQAKNYMKYAFRVVAYHFVYFRIANSLGSVK